jgi:hypothetical protein
MMGSLMMWSANGAAISVCSLSQPKSNISDFGQLKMPNSGKPEFGWERGGVRGYGLSIGFEPPHPNPLPKRGEGADRVCGVSVGTHERRAAA